MSNYNFYTKEEFEKIQIEFDRIKNKLCLKKNGMVYIPLGIKTREASESKRSGLLGVIKTEPIEGVTITEIKYRDIETPEGMYTYRDCDRPMCGNPYEYIQEMIDDRTRMNQMKHCLKAFDFDLIKIEKEKKEEV
jgi:hypothetical protein